MLVAARRTVASSRTRTAEAQADAVEARCQAGGVEQRDRLGLRRAAEGLDTRLVPGRGRRHRAVCRPPMPGKIALDDRFPVDRARDRSANADVVEAETRRLVVEREIDERRLLERDDVEVGVRRQSVDVEQRRILDAVDEPVLERRGPLLLVRQRNPSDAVEVRRPAVLEPADARARVRVPALDLLCHVRIEVLEPEGACAVRGCPSVVVPARVPRHLGMDRRVPRAQQGRKAGARVAETDDDRIAIGSNRIDDVPEAAVQRRGDRVGVKRERGRHRLGIARCALSDSARPRESESAIRCRPRSVSSRSPLTGRARRPRPPRSPSRRSHTRPDRRAHPSPDHNGRTCSRSPPGGSRHAGARPRLPPCRECPRPTPLLSTENG